MKKNLFTFNIRVYYEDTDAGGIVYYANYLKFFERTRTEWLRALGYDQSLLADTTDCIFIVKELDMKYVSPARLDDNVQVSACIQKLGKASIVFKQEAQARNITLASGSIQVACVNRHTLKPSALPVGLHEHLSSLLAKEPVSP